MNRLVSNHLGIASELRASINPPARIMMIENRLLDAVRRFKNPRRFVEAQCIYYGSLFLLATKDQSSICRALWDGLTHATVRENFTSETFHPAGRDGMHDRGTKAFALVVDEDRRLICDP